MQTLLRLKQNAIDRQPVLGCFITPAGCSRLNSELGIFYALAVTSFFLNVQAQHWRGNKIESLGKRMVIGVERNLVLVI